MIQEYSRLNVADNSGAKKVMCFRILGGTRRRYARIGDIIVVAVVQGTMESTRLSRGRREDPRSYAP